jgi:hypothetical protein
MAAAAAVAFPHQAAAAPVLRDAGKELPPGAVRGPADQLHQYPSIKLATPEQRAAAQALLDEVRALAPGWRDPAAAKAAGYSIRTRPRQPGDTRVHYLHAERRPGEPYFDPEIPKAIIYANAPGRPLTLVGVMFSMPRGRHGPTPGGPITRWHTHAVCMEGDRRGTPPRPDGSCPPGSKKRQGSEMMHIWLTADLRSAFAIHAPPHELCLAGLLPAPNCDHAEHSHG